MKLLKKCPGCGSKLKLLETYTGAQRCIEECYTNFSQYFHKPIDNEIPSAYAMWFNVDQFHLEMNEEYTFVYEAHVKNGKVVAIYSDTFLLKLQTSSIDLSDLEKVNQKILKLIPFI